MVRAISPRLGRTVCSVTGEAAGVGFWRGGPQPQRVARAQRVAKRREWKDGLARWRHSSSKSEIRNPKSEGRPKSEIRTGPGRLGCPPRLTAVHLGSALRATCGLRFDLAGLNPNGCHF